MPPPAPSSPVLALAGRRIDAPEARPSRFPLQNAPEVRRLLQGLMSALGARTLVCSAAAGADLLALDAALERGLRLRVVLPFDRVRFREVSVADRPGDFGPLFDRIIDTVGARGDLVVLDGAAPDAASYRVANAAILDEAARLAHPALPVAVIAWDGRPWGSEDATAAFASGARSYGWSVLEVLTTPEAPPAVRTR